jgi:3',5'-cyclic AMP phosphodiesterase CpdA
MRRVAHLSDLHFGREDPVVAAGLAADLSREKVDLVVVSGDLTQRARRAQFQAARAWLDGLGVPWIAVPGNHDIPLFDVPRRVVDPFGRYRSIVCPDLEPEHLDDELAVLGLNTVLPWVWKGGLVRRRFYAHLRRWSEAAGDRVRIVFAHHPFTRHAHSRSDLVRGWRQAVLAMEEAGVDLVLTGHHHRFGHSESRDVPVGGPHRLVVVRASTSISHRRRGEPNSYSLLHLDGKAFGIEGRTWKDGRFAAGATHSYRRIAAKTALVQS